MALKLNKIYNMDCIEGMKQLKDKTIDLVIVDPPYYKIMIKNHLGEKYDWDNQWNTKEDYIHWCKKWFKELKRIIKSNGSLYIFADDKICAYIQIELDKYFNLENNIIWVKKNNMTIKGWNKYRCFAPITERILFYSKESRTSNLENECYFENVKIFSSIIDYMIEQKKKIKEYFKDSFKSDKIRFVDSNTKNKQSIIEKFNDSKDKLRILISTDTLSEGYNISGADVVINFDIPYNPVRIIQRVGRATRLDKPKEIEVFNFRPDDDIDVELKLVETMEFRIKDIIRFVGIEYRIWFEAEKELLKERRKKDEKLYIEILDKIRGNIRENDFSKLEIPLSYSKPILIFLQKAIKKYKLKKEDLQSIRIPKGNNYTLLKGSKGLCVICEDIDSFNEEILLEKDIVETSNSIIFEREFVNELKLFSDFKEDKKKENLRLQYFNDKVDKTVNSIFDYISSKKLVEMYPNISDLENNLELVKDRCGSTTEKIVRKIKLEIKDNVSKEKTDQWNHELENSFTKLDYQEKILPKKESLFALGFIEE